MDKIQLRSVPRMLNLAAKHFGKKTIYEENNETVTFAELKDIAEKVATQVACISAANKPVLIWSTKSVKTPALYMGVLAAGCYYAPLGLDTPFFRVRTILDVMKPQVLLTDGIPDEELVKLEFTGKIIKLNDCTETDAELVNARTNSIVDTDPMYVVFTSGSTGTPKGVVATHRGTVDYLTSFVSHFSIDETAVFGSQVPFEYIAGIREMYVPLITGCKTVIVPKTLFKTPLKIAEYVHQKEITLLYWTTAMYTVVYDFKIFDDLKPDRIKNVFFAGSVMQPKVFYYLRDNIPNAMFAQHYGTTETIGCTYYVAQPGKNYDNGVPVGKAIINRRCFLIDEENKLVTEPDKKGEFVMNDTANAIGYFRESEKTAEHFVQNPFHNDYPDICFLTKDIGSYNDDGDMVFHGRSDRQIKHMGFRVELAEIELAATKCEGVTECSCVYDVNKAVIWLVFAGEATEQAVSAHLRGALPSFMLPRKFLAMKTLPRMYNGKIDLQELKKICLKP